MYMTLILLFVCFLLSMKCMTDDWDKGGDEKLPIILIIVIISTMMHLALFMSQFKL